MDAIYHQNARECVMRAESVESDEIRCIYLDLAHRWLELAHEVLRIKVLTSRPPEPTAAYPTNGSPTERDLPDDGSPVA
jgi:hypothetical protein